MKNIAIFWFRRDLRWVDNHGFYRALQSGYNVLPIFIFDTEILDNLSDKQDARVSFIYRKLELLHEEFIKYGSSLQLWYGKPTDIFQKLMETYSIQSVYTNSDYEPYAIKRDQQVQSILNARNIDFLSFKDQVIFEKSEVMKSDGLPYTIFTPYSKIWKQKLANNPIQVFPSESYLKNLYPISLDFPKIEQIGFQLNSRMIIATPQIEENTLIHYHETRNIPSLEQGTTRLSTYIRFGTVSIRTLVIKALQTNEQWLNELIWREFFMMILFHFPSVVHHCFKPKYEHIQWRNDEAEFEKWKEGKTGYPIVDAGMRELNQTGFMHNRVRMIVASFLTKHLLIDWRWGEAYFAEKLMDYDLSANNGNWQWATGCGCDAAPYFRVFNPSEQSKEFDPQGLYVQKWLSPNDLMTAPMVDHSTARLRALTVYKHGLE